ncbi:hypothetical protein [Clostridium beijerinckii]|uniref:hypothetical protein n=1 Tax=Clostridium beijerinckii TaxID=1520 RepID=UPI00047D581D|nr:hypothetical protein [Clostridium beijerinckii]
MILAIDPGNVESGYALLNDDLSIVEKGKIENEYVLDDVIPRFLDVNLNEFLDKNNECKLHIAIEMVASYGMAVGATVFETCMWIGRFYQKSYEMGLKPQLIYRKEEKLNICGSMKAKDSNIIQALIDRFAPNTTNKGKGTKKEPGWFYGFKKDIWQAYAVGVTYYDIYINPNLKKE